MSRATVSRVLNGSPLVKEETRAAVQKVIDDMNYVPSLAARSLVHRRSYVVGMLVQNVLKPFWAGMYAGVEQQVAGSDYGVFLVNCKNNQNLWDHRREYKKNMRNLVQRGVDGLIIALLQELDREDAAFLKDAGIPHVVIQDHRPLRERGLWVNADNRTGAYRATRHLIDQGHRHILHVMGPPESGVAQDRMQGYLQAMGEAGLPVDEDSIVRCGFWFKDGYWATKRILTELRGFTAIVYANDSTAYGGYLAAREAGLTIPDHLSIVGFDHLVDEIDIAELLPDLTSMVQSVQSLGATAARLLMDKMDGGGEVESQTHPLTFHKGSTTAPPAGEAANPASRQQNSEGENPQ